MRARPATIIFGLHNPIEERDLNMVKKRVRDPEVLAEAPQVQDEDSGSDTVGLCLRLPILKF